ncbi:hypothetical protein [Coleofasciculus sp. E1-EBD-02]|jgi:hypothetical protein
MNEHHYYIGLLLILLVFGFELLVQSADINAGSRVRSRSSRQEDSLLVSR